MFFLHVSNRTENLLRQLAEVIRVDKQPDIFSAELFLIQSQGMERMLAQRLADEFVSFCNFKFFLPLDFLKYIAKTVGLAIEADGFDRQTLTWRIEDLLHDIDGDEYRPLQRYLQGDNSEIKRYQLSTRLANLFDQYQLLRGDFLDGWRQGRLATESYHESWQMNLWQRLLAQPGGDNHRGLLLHNVVKLLQEEVGFTPLLPKRISIFGVHTMPPLFLHFFNGLSHHMDVHLYLLSPCKQYWGNIESRKRQFKRLAKTVQASGEPELYDHHPLLASLGQQGKDLQNIMLEAAEFSLEVGSYDNPAEIAEDSGRQATLLEMIQADMLSGTAPKKSVEIDFNVEHSVQLVSCHSRIRELTVLKDHLLDLLYKDKTLELKDIVVMAPDIQEYAAFIPAIFDTIQHSIADKSLRRRNSILSVFISFLNLFGGRFETSEVMDVLRQPSIFPQFGLGLSDLETLQKWIQEAGIRWGLSSSQRELLNLLPFEECSWRAGLDRLLMGLAIDSEEFISGVLPFSGIEGKGAAPLGGLCHFIDLLEEGSADFAKKYTVIDWATVLRLYSVRLFGENSDKEFDELGGIIDELGEVAHEFHGSEVSFDIIVEWISAIAQESRSSSGFLRGQLTFCSMLPMRSIPFRVVCLLGLNDGVFPRNDVHETFDLLGPEGGTPRLGDRSKRADDRYLFLEAILAARSVLYISFIGQSITTNDPIPPSVVVSEFIDLLEQGYGAEDVVVAHPLHPFSRHYFDQEGDPQLFSYDLHYFSVAERVNQEPQPLGQWWQGAIEPADERGVIFSDLLTFYRNPQKYFVKNQLGIELGLEEIGTVDTELFVPTGLDNYFVDQLLFEKMEQLVEADEQEFAILAKKFQSGGLWPLGEPGTQSLRTKVQGLKFYWDIFRSLDLGQPINDLDFDLTVDGVSLQGLLGNRYEGGIAIVRLGALRGRDILEAWIHQLVTTEIAPGEKTYLVAAEGCYQFADREAGADIPSLQTFVTAYLRGCHRVLPFYIEPSFIYAKQAASSRARVPPLTKALDHLNNSIEKGYQPEWELLLSGGEDFSETAEFEELAKTLMCPLYDLTMRGWMSMEDACE